MYGANREERKTTWSQVLAEIHQDSNTNQPGSTSEERSADYQVFAARLQISRLGKSRRSRFVATPLMPGQPAEVAALGACRSRPESEPFFRLAKTAKQAMLDVGCIVDAAGCSQTEKGPLAAGSNSPTGSAGTATLLTPRAVACRCQIRTKCSRNAIWPGSPAV